MFGGCQARHLLPSFKQTMAFALYPPLKESQCLWTISMKSTCWPVPFDPYAQVPVTTMIDHLCHGDWQVGHGGSFFCSGYMRCKYLCHIGEASSGIVEQDENTKAKLRTPIFFDMSWMMMQWIIWNGWWPSIQHSYCIVMLSFQNLQNFRFGQNKQIDKQKVQLTRQVAYAIHLTFHQKNVIQRIR